MLWVGLPCVIVVFPNHTHLPFAKNERAAVESFEEAEIVGGLFNPVDANEVGMQFGNFNMAQSSQCSQRNRQSKTDSSLD